MAIEAEQDLFERGIENAVAVCMGVHPGDRVFVLTDEATARVGDALTTAALARCGVAEVHRMEEYGERPVTALRDLLRQHLEGFRPTVTFYAAAGVAGEIAFRIPFLELLTRDLRVRHGHMIGIDERLILQGMQANYAEVAQLTNAVAERARAARGLRATSPAGTDLVVRFSPALRWKPCTGIYLDAGTWGNLPEGEVFTCPERVDGVLVGQVIGDYFSERYGVLPKPVVIEVEDSRVRKVSGATPEIAAELHAYLNSTENGNRAGEFAIGTNTAVTTLTGNLLQDEKIPGIHIAFGNPYPLETGADWRADVHVDIVSVGGDASLDGVPLLREGRFV